MIPLIRTAELCQQSRSLVEKSTLELMELYERNLKTHDYIMTRRTYLQTAGWSPVSRPHELQAAPAYSLPTVRSGDAGWNKRALETRCFAEKIEDAGVKREMMELAEQYDRLGGCDSAANLPPAVHVPSHLGAIGA